MPLNDFDELQLRQVVYFHGSSKVAAQFAAISVKSRDKRDGVLTDSYALRTISENSYTMIRDVKREDFTVVPVPVVPLKPGIYKHIYKDAAKDMVDYYTFTKSRTWLWLEEGTYEWTPITGPVYPHDELVRVGLN